MTDPIPEGFDAIIEALTIFKRHANPAYPFHCEHDTLYVCVDPDAVPAEDKARLEELGFIEDPDTEGFLSFRFGSA